MKFSEKFFSLQVDPLLLQNDFEVDIDRFNIEEVRWTLIFFS